MVPTANTDPSDHPAGDTGPQLGAQTAAVLDRLRGRTAPVTLSELAAEVVDSEPYRHDRPDEGATPDIDRVELRLHHVDLPALSVAGFLDYDEGGHLVSPCARRDQERPVLDETFDLLAHRHRRAVIECLDEHPSIRVEDLAAAVAQAEHPDAPGEPPAAAIEQVRHALHHIHLPKLRQAHIVRFDRARALVTATENAHWLFSALRCADRSREHPQPRSP